MVFQHAIAPNFHGGREFAPFDGKFPLQDPKLANLLEGRETAVDACDGLLDFGFEGLRNLGRIHRDESGDIRQAIADENYLIDDWLGLEEELDPRG